LTADRGYDANSLRCTLRAEGTIPVIPGRCSRKRPIRHDVRRYRDRWRIEAAFCRLKDFRRVATRYDKLAINFPVGRRPRCNHRFLDLNESGP
jgi:transposase